MIALYSDNDPKVCAWMRELVKAGHLPKGRVDERSIEEIKPGDCVPSSHFFCGIGGWPHALMLAGWPTDEPVWTGSCPCQPFSQAGKRRGFADKRHLWPEWRRLIAECRPSVCFGEQIASPLGREWLAGVRVDLEALGYAVGAADLCAAGVAAPHIRQRLFWVAYADEERSASNEPQPLEKGQTDTRSVETGELPTRASRRCGTCRLANPHSVIASDKGLQRSGQFVQPAEDTASGRVGDSRGTGLEKRIGNGRIESVQAGTNPWQTFELAGCRDGKDRRVEPSIQPLAHGLPARVVRLRGYGNAIVPQVAAAFIRAFMGISTEV